MKRGKLSSYILYTLGEIFLVVIGILIALQVNNWNIERGERNKEALFLQNLERDLKKQKEAILFNMAGEEMVVNSLGDALMSYHKNWRFEINSKNIVDISPINDRYTFTIIRPTYSEMLSTGGLDLLSNKTLKDQLVLFYSALELTEQIIQNNNNHKDNTISLKSLGLTEIIGPNINLNKPTLKGSFDDYRTPDHILNLVREVLKSPENELALLNSIRYRRNIANWHVKKLNEALEMTQYLLSLMDD